jgi:aminoglycoside phosphotransferase family enzyme
MHRLAACGFLVLARRASFQHQDPLSGQMWNGDSTPQQGCEVVKTVLGFSERASENPQPNQNGFSQMQIVNLRQTQRN